MTITHPIVFFAVDSCIDTLELATQAHLIFWYSEGMAGKFIAISGIVAVVLLAIVLQLTTPATIGPLGLLFVFIMLYMAALSVLTFLIFAVSWASARAGNSLTVRRPVQPLSLRQAYYYGSIVALAPVMLLGMQSVGAVGIYETVLVVLFAVLGCVYIAKRSR